jgi:OHCU decarboxylase
MSHSLQTLNLLPAPEFVRVVGPLFEHSPWIAERAAPARPFTSAAHLHAALVAVVAAASSDEQIALIRAHPDLAGKLAIAGELTAHSTAEQQSARLDRLSPGQFARITALNDRYRATFGFPFVICVKDHTQDSIMCTFEERVNHTCADEIPAALHQIGRIAWHRLQSLLSSA